MAEGGGSLELLAGERNGGAKKLGREGGKREGKKEKGRPRVRT